MLRTTATSNTVFIMRHKTVPSRSSSKVQSSHAMFKKSVQQRAAKKPARKVVGIGRTNSLLQKLHEPQRADAANSACVHLMKKLDQTVIFLFLSIAIGYSPKKQQQQQQQQNSQI
jgi:hypothetical protein